MDLMQVIYQLRRERDEIVEAIRSLERLESSTVAKKKGRPPKAERSESIPPPIQQGRARGPRQSRTQTL
jgi:hypothetical protein